MLAGREGSWADERNEKKVEKRKNINLNLNIGYR
jgi:hypothetical protein